MTRLKASIPRLGILMLATCVSSLAGAQDVPFKRPLISKPMSKGPVVPPIRPAKIDQPREKIKPPVQPAPAQITGDQPAGFAADVDGDAGPAVGLVRPADGERCRPTRGKLLFEFKNADIKDIVEQISKHTCRNFILTSKVRSQKFDIISRSPITVDEMWEAFLSSLEANDFSIVLVGRYYKVIQATDATRAPVEIFDTGEKHPSDDRMITVIWTLRYSPDINAVVNYMNIFKSGKGQIHPFARTNTVIATDFATSIDRLERVLKEIDQPGVLERLHVVSVEFASASEIAEKLNQIFEPQKSGGKAGGSQAAARIAAGPEGAATPAHTEQEFYSVSKIIPDDRTNKLIIIASDESFKQIMSLKRQLDTPAEAGEGLVYVVRLRHANAEDLASTLSSLASGKPTTPRRGRAGAKGPTPPPGAAGAAGPSAAVLFEGDIKVTSDKPTNSLVITASKSDFNSLKRVIAQLDVPRLQVYVEAVILEVAVKRDRSFGLSWHGGVNASIDGKDSPILFGNSHRDFSSLSLTSNPISLASLLGFAGAARGPTLEGTESIIQGGIPALGVVIQALASSNDVNVVSTPNLLTMDNEDAEIQVNEKRPFPSGLSLGGLSGLSGLAGGGSNLGGLNLSGLGLGSVSFNREDVGLTLKLKPTINDQETVRLELDQELSDVAGTDAVTGQTITSKRSAKTVVVVRDQDSVVIGGLVRDRETTDESKIPILGDIPLLGWLFKKQQRVSEKINLVLVLTPYIIRGPDDFRRIYERKMSERREFLDLYYGESKEYRAEIDWEKKVGPLAAFRRSIREELNRPENEGPGDGTETVIKADDVIELGPGRPGGSSGTTLDTLPGPGAIPDEAPTVIDPDPDSEN
ncbi:MAG: type II secretion system secretin GspD [Deltaproteobacteria bacterium]|nr:type II secretion system secretin GspD [Deltaproteobacteria bacterium]